MRDTDRAEMLQDKSILKKGPKSVEEDNNSFQFYWSCERCERYNFT